MEYELTHTYMLIMTYKYVGRVLVCATIASIIVGEAHWDNVSVGGES